MRRLQAEPLCRDCKEKGVITAATAPDHIVPLALGGSDDDSNVRCLCPECHLERPREQFGHRARSTIGEDGWPLWGGAEGDQSHAITTASAGCNATRQSNTIYLNHIQTHRRALKRTSCVKRQQKEK